MVAVIGAQGPTSQEPHFTEGERAAHGHHVEAAEGQRRDSGGALRV